VAKPTEKDYQALLKENAILKKQLEFAKTAISTSISVLTGLNHQLEQAGNFISAQKLYDSAASKTTSPAFQNMRNFKNLSSAADQNLTTTESVKNPSNQPPAGKTPGSKSFKS